MKRPSLSMLLIIGFVLLLMALESVAVYRVYALRVPGTADFLARWYGARELVLRDRNPYDRAIELEAQLALFGRYTNHDEDQVNFAYPLYVIYLFWPLTFVSYAWAQAVWMVVLQFALLGLTLLGLGLLRWRPPPGLLAATLLWSLYFYPGTRAIMLGQFSVLVALFLLLSLWALSRGQDVWAGLILPLTTIKPQMVFLVLPLILLWALRLRRWRFIAAFGGSALFLVGSSMFWVPDWPWRFLGNLSAYSGYVGFGSPLENLTARFTPAIDTPLRWLITISLLGLMLWQWWQTLRHQPESLLWALWITLLVGNLIAFRSATANHVILYPAMLLLFKRHLGGPLAWRVLALQVGSSVFLWVLFLTTIDTSRGDNFEAIFMHGLMPALLLIVFLIDWRALRKANPQFPLSPPAKG